MNFESLDYSKSPFDHWPEIFPKIRGQQKFVIQKIWAALEAGKKYIVAEMPTGSGKSPVTQTFARLVQANGGSSHLLTIQLLLQDQYLRDFPPPEIEVVKGRSNFECNHADSMGQDAAHGVCKNFRRGILPECVSDTFLPGEGEALNPMLVPSQGHKCPYWRQLLKAAENPITLFNFDSFLFQQRMGRFGKRPLMVIDEAHNIESKIMGFVSMKMYQEQLIPIDVMIDQKLESVKGLLAWLIEQDVEAKIKGRLAAAKGPEDSVPGLDDAQRDELQALLFKINFFKKMFEKTEWVVEVKHETPKSKLYQPVIHARPLYARAFADPLLFSKADRILCVSATILDVNVWAKNLGIPIDDVEFIRVGSDFPPANRPIYIEKSINMGSKHFNQKHKDWPKMRASFLGSISKILDRHGDHRGIIHCHKWELYELIRNSFQNPRLIFQKDYKTKSELLAAHEGNPTGVLVAPAMHEGLDLKDDLSRFQIICKTPWPDAGDRVIRMRMQKDGDWYAWLAALKFVQAYGRSVRSKNDWAITYVIDASFTGFVQEHGQMIPGWVKDAIRWGTPVSGEIVPV